MIDNTIANIFSLLFLLSCFLLLCEPRYSRRRTLLVSGAVFVVCTAAFLLGRRYGMSPPVASALFLTLPSFFLFAPLSKHRGFRYIFTFCSVDIWGMMIYAACNLLELRFGLVSWQTILLCVALYLAMLAGSCKLAPAYRRIQSTLEKGWGGLALLSMLFYVLLYLHIGFPAPIRERLEYIPVVLIEFLMIGVIYVILFQLLRNLNRNREFQQNEYFLKMQLELKNAQIKEQELYYQLAYIDGLTLLKNRAALAKREGELDGDWARALPFSCILCDLNNLKETNDTLGHLAGDGLIQGLANVLRGCGDEEDLYRTGGDEFLVLLSHCGPERLGERLVALRSGVEAYNRTHQPVISVAVGSASAVSPDRSLRELETEADRAMYRDKARMHRARPCPEGSANDEAAPEKDGQTI